MRNSRPSGSNAHKDEKQHPLDTKIKNIQTAEIKESDVSAQLAKLEEDHKILLANKRWKEIDALYTDVKNILNNRDSIKFINQIRKKAEQGQAFFQYILGFYYENLAPFKEAKQAFTWYEKAAYQKLAIAQYTLALCYGRGMLALQDQKQAVAWYEKAAIQGYPNAQYNLALRYQEGIGTVKDEQKAVEWYKRAAIQGNVDAQHDLGACYAEGWGTVIKDEKKAFEWWEKAANQGNANAQFNLGLCYREGWGTVIKDEKKAFEWWEKAANQGNADAQNNLGSCYGEGRGTVKDEKKAFIWYEKAATQGNSYAQNSLGAHYREGRGTVKDENKAFEWYEKAANQGNADAQCNLGGCYAIGRGTVKDEKKAFIWYEKAAIQGSSYAQNNLGTCYEEGRGTVKNEKKAFSWYEKAAIQGSSYAQNNLGTCYVIGLGTVKDEKKAFEWYEKAANQGNADAQYHLGLSYKIGKGTDRDEQKAIQFWEKAIKQGEGRVAREIKDILLMSNNPTYQEREILSYARLCLAEFSALCHPRITPPAVLYNLLRENTTSFAVPSLRARAFELIKIEKLYLPREGKKLSNLVNSRCAIKACEEKNYQKANEHFSKLTDLNKLPPEDNNYFGHFFYYLANDEKSLSEDERTSFYNKAYSHLRIAAQQKIEESAHLLNLIAMNLFNIPCTANNKFFPNQYPETLDEYITEFKKQFDSHQTSILPSTSFFSRGLRTYQATEIKAEDIFAKEVINQIKSFIDAKIPLKKLSREELHHLAMDKNTEIKLPSDQLIRKDLYDLIDNEEINGIHAISDLETIHTYLTDRIKFLEKQTQESLEKISPTFRAKIKTFAKILDIIEQATIKEIYSQEERLGKIFSTRVTLNKKEDAKTLAKLENLNILLRNPSHDNFYQVQHQITSLLKECKEQEVIKQLNELDSLLIQGCIDLSSFSSKIFPPNPREKLSR